jgi:hypothetical protein
MICRIDTRQDLPQGTDKVRAFLDRRQIPSNCGARRTFNWASDQPGLQLTSLDKIFYHNSDRPWHRIRHPSALRQITGIKLLLALAAAIAGIGTSFVIRKIVEPNHQWSAFFIRQYKPPARYQPKRVFPMRDGETDPKTIDEIDPGEIGKLIMRLLRGDYGVLDYCGGDC